ncbi:MAG: polysulfide reductase NrfD [Planctomycetes bacterium]|nr:polysulfide reductase NrfD [Planctomycetota bacterium]
MTNYGFLIDQRKCIGCHACTTACKSENHVPVGKFRTWVKYVEKGTFPAVRRHFAVLRCNHCSNAPCVTICPVNALHKRSDGIVDLDRDACIGCKGCMQACPYDAIYLNEDTGSAEKCHFCAHRVERQLEPACVVVCPERAIVAGDLDDPKSEIRRMISQHPVSQRKVEQGTGPKLFYVDADTAVLTPTEPRHEEAYLWSERAEPAPQGANFDPDAVSRVAYDVAHPAPWGWKVGAYLWTKAISAGAAMLAPFAAPLGLGGGAEKYGPEAAALLFLGVTSFLLVEDLARPMKFYTILTRPNWKSWLVRGAVILSAFGACLTASLAAQFLGLEKIVPALRWCGAVLGVGAAGYSGFLFAQAEGRDFWQSPLRAPHLVVEALVAGAALAVLVGASAGTVLLGSLAAHALFLGADLATNHGGNDAERAKHLLIAGVFAKPFWLSIVLGLVLPAALLLLMPALAPVAAVAALLGLLGYGLLWVRVGQAIPLS